jgi:hypothetical protein
VRRAAILLALVVGCSATPHPPPPALTAAKVIVTQTPPTTTTIPGPPVQAGCPPPPPPPPSHTPPWHPKVLVPESALPPTPTVAPWTSQLDAIGGKGMWIWEWDQTDGGSVAAVIKQATAAGLHQIWVRVADSPDGFYGGPTLAALVDPAHAAGLSVIAWGFPYLYDPVRDASWTAQVLSWRSPAGGGVDGWSADLEMSSEGVAMDARRASLYLALVRHAAGARLVVATVYPPFDSYWSGAYPYASMSPYVDAFAPMEYWECVDPGGDAVQALARLKTLRPVHIIGQAYSMASSGGRVPSPSAAELTRFMAVGLQRGALGASFWVWQSATPEEWNAVSSFAWPAG